MGMMFLLLLFIGWEWLFVVIDVVVMLGMLEVIIGVLQWVLCEVIVDLFIQLFFCVWCLVEGYYVCCELYCSLILGYSVIVMCWGLGQGMFLYDYDVMWCVEGVWQGELIVIFYVLIEQDGECYCFVVQFMLYGYRGSVGSLILLYEYYMLCNVSDVDVVVLLYVYEGVMECSVVFELLDDGWYQCWMKWLEIEVF